MFPISDDSPRRHGLPYVNIGLIAISAIVFLYELTLTNLDQTVFFYKFGLIPKELTEGISFECLATTRDLLGRVATGPHAGAICDVALARGARDISSPIGSWGTVFSSMFIHGGVLHFLGNMVFLWVFGDNVEDRLGHLRYLAFYVAMGVVAAWTQIGINMGSEIPTIGASGAIAGVLGAYLLLYPYNQVRTLVVFFFITFIRIPAVYLLGFWIVLQFFNGIGSLDSSIRSGGVAYWAHIGGFAAGVIAIALLKLLVWRERPIPRRPRSIEYWDFDR